jgi:hypothetical protein
MKISEITYNRTFNLGNFNSERIGVRIEINEGESVTQALEAAKQLVEETHKNNYPNLVVEPIIEQTLTKEQITEGNLKAINDCTTLQELESYKLLTKQGKQEFNAYNTKLKELTK